MNFKKKAGSAVLAIAAASAIAVPGIAVAESATAVETVATSSAPTVSLSTTGDKDVDISSSDDIAEFEDNIDDDGWDETYDVINVEISGSSLDEDEIQDFLDDYGKYVTGALTISNSDIEELDVSNAVNATALYLTAGDLTNLDGLDDFGSSNGSGSVTLDITASDLSDIDFGDNDATGDITISSDLESISVAGLDNLTVLDVSGCSDLVSLDISDNDSLDSLNIAGTQLAHLDTSDSDISETTDDWDDNEEGQGLYVGDGIELDDSHYATVTENDDDDDYNDYSFDLDSIVGGYAEDISDDAGDFTVTTTNSSEVTGDDDATDNLYTDDDWFDYDDGELTITAEDAPTSIQFTMEADEDDSDISYTVVFDVQSEGERISGDDRYDTMVQINTNEGDNNLDEVFDGATDVVIASGEGYADALSASALAGALDTGIVTTASDSLTDDTIDMLDDMDDQGTAYIVGGTSAVSYAVEQQLTDLGFSIDRFAGSDRFDTAVDVQDEIQDMIDAGTADSNNKTVIIASGASYADALAVAPYAYTQNIPIVLVGADGTMDDDTAALFNKYKTDYSRAIVVGGTSVVSEDVIDTFEGYDMDVIRLAGSDRYETNLVINDWLDRGASDISSSDEIFEAAGYSDDDIDDFNDAGINATDGANDFDGQAYVVTGTNYADALAVAPLAGLNNGTINMVYSGDISTVTEAKDNDADTTIIGGTSVISSDLEDEIEAL